MDKVIKAVPLADHTIDILTSSGVAGVFDVKPYLQDSVFQELRNEAYFRLVRPAHHGIAWPYTVCLLKARRRKTGELLRRKGKRRSRCEAEFRASLKAR
jgi:hypothetical protein